MGTTYFSVSFRTSDLNAVTTTLKKLAKKARAAAYVGKPTQGWITVFPNVELMSDKMVTKIAESSGSSHEIILNLLDGDVLSYWLFQSGEMVDHYNSCPDYFGTEDEAELEATGDPTAFKDLLNATQQKQLAKLLKPRMINGEEVGGALPEMEEHRFASLIDLLGIIGANSCYEYLEEGDEASGLGKAKNMIHVTRK